MKLPRIIIGVLCIAAGSYLMFRSPERPANVSAQPAAPLGAPREPAAVPHVAPLSAIPETSRGDALKTVPRSDVPASIPPPSNASTPSGDGKSFASELLARA